MGIVLALDRARRSGGRAGVSVSLDVRVGDAEDTAEWLVDLRVRGGKMPIRLYLHVDGQLVDAWVDSCATYALPPSIVAGGHHVLCARAVDALGRSAKRTIAFVAPAPPGEERSTGR
jgi:hypothetical protein